MLTKTKITWHIAGIRTAITQTFKKGRQPTVQEFAAFNARYEELLDKLHRLGMAEDELEKELRHMLQSELNMSLEDFVALGENLAMEAGRNGVLV